MPVSNQRTSVSPLPQVQETLQRDTVKDPGTQGAALEEQQEQVQEQGQGQGQEDRCLSQEGPEEGFRSQGAREQPCLGQGGPYEEAPKNPGKLEEHYDMEATLSSWCNRGQQRGVSKGTAKPAGTAPGKGGVPGTSAVDLGRRSVESASQAMKAGLQAEKRGARHLVLVHRGLKQAHKQGKQVYRCHSPLVSPWVTEACAGCGEGMPLRG